MRIDRPRWHGGQIGDILGLVFHAGSLRPGRPVWLLPPRIAPTMAKTLEVRVPHALNQDEIKRRLDEALVRARSDYADSVGEITAQWDGEEKMRFNLAVAGMKFDGSLEICIEELLVTLQLPGAAALFSGRIREGIQERLGGLVG